MTYVALDWAGPGQLPQITNYYNLTKTLKITKLTKLLQFDKSTKNYKIDDIIANYYNLTKTLQIITKLQFDKSTKKCIEFGTSHFAFPT